MREWYHWISYFYIYCFLGWCFESTYVSLREHTAVNRGFLKLPLLPLYGTGALLLLGISMLLSDHLMSFYIVGAAAATWLEYVTGYGMERLFRVKYWDYSSQRFQFQGHICLSSSIVWGFMAILVTKGIHNGISRMIRWLPVQTEGVILIIVSILFICDAVISTKTELQMAKMRS